MWAVCFESDLCPPAPEYQCFHSACGSLEHTINTTLWTGNRLEKVIYMHIFIKTVAICQHRNVISLLSRPLICICVLLLVNEAKLSLTSVTVMVTVVVAVLPVGIPLMSWALTTSTYWLVVSRSREFILQLITPAERQRRCYLWGQLWLMLK